MRIGIVALCQWSGRTQIRITFEGFKTATESVVAAALPPIDRTGGFRIKTSVTVILDFP